MGIRYLRTHAALEGHVGPDDAEPLLAWLRERPRAQVHLGRCETLHTAVLQTLLACAPAIKAAPASPWLRRALGLAATDTPQGRTT